ncbi:MULTISPECIES: NAD-dependent epimerase/dehydratase family protein [Actinosynnema]|uniref:Nucleoside-diphosphate sugar epimerase n=1 Tax=Actinosynnema pretiosum TaxID=42197 RepID=A0A290ZAC5_9PSEU|nr:NAD(P)-dependent oxidoreductase [Actinosynnema pretiosum]ATE55944.1 nucleoside-diphosphate sugar epimerase [Actinosynnema pretiosum]
MRIAVIGASGLIGQHIGAELVARGHRVTSVARTPREGVDHALDVETTGVDRWTELLDGHDGYAFAAGSDDRATPRRPAYPHFRRGNVEPVAALSEAAARVGASGAVVLGSYYTHFHRAHPEWELAGRHPYIRSRVEQARAARRTGLPVTVLELPFVFGRAGARLPNWAPALASWARSRVPLVAPPGGTAATTARRVAEEAATALEERADRDTPVVDENLTWAELLARTAEAVGAPARTRGLPAAVVRGALVAGGALAAVSGREPGLHLPGLADLLLRELFVHPATGSVQRALEETFAR